MPVRLTEGDGVMLAEISGELDHHSVRSIRQEIDNNIAALTITELILDFGAVTFMDSSGIGLIMGRYKLISDMGGKLVIANTPTHMKKVMKVAGLDRLATMNDNKIVL